MTTTEHQIYQALAEGRDKLSERFEAMEDARNFWRFLAILFIVLAALDILQQWAGWTL